MNFCLVSLLLLPIASSLTNYPIVQTSYGRVRGYEHHTISGFVGEIYKKIPYASPPIGERRWKKAEPPQPWNYTHDGTFFGPSCAQVPSMHTIYITGISEDCLVMNIYTSKQCRESSCPMILYLHGGGGIYGGVNYPDEALVMNYPRQGVILVTIQYRLGPFGTMALGDESVLPANLAMHDVIASLRFLHSEAHAFGGNKDEITVMGHSSGATMIVAMVFSAGVNKPGDILFSRAIPISATTVFETEEKQMDITHRVAKKVGCEGTAREIIDCLRQCAMEAILQATDEIGGTNPFSTTQMSSTTLAGELMAYTNMKDFREQQKEHLKNFAKPTKITFGALLGEFKDGAGPGDRRVQPATVVGVRNEEECIEKYWSDVETGKFDPGYVPIAQGFYMTARLFGQAHVDAGGEVYIYQLDYPKHMHHADDLYYLMGTKPFEKDENEEWISRIYPVYLTNFVKGEPLAPDWNHFDPVLMNYYSINKSYTDGVSPMMKYNYHQNLADYYDELVKFDDELTIARKQITVTSEPLQLRYFFFYSIMICAIFFVFFNIFNSKK